MLDHGNADDHVKLCTGRYSKGPLDHVQTPQGPVVQGQPANIFMLHLHPFELVQQVISHALFINR